MFLYFRKRTCVLFGIFFFLLFWVLFSFGLLRLLLFVLRAICFTVTCLSVLDIIYNAKYSSVSILASMPSILEGENMCTTFLVYIFTVDLGRVPIMS